MKFLVIAAAAALAAPAMAGVGSSASLTGLRFDLVDLDTGDSVAPGISFTGVSHVQALLTRHYCTSTSPNCENDYADFNGLSSVAMQNDDPNGIPKTAFAMASQAGLFAGGTFGSTDSGGARTNSDEYRAYARFQGRPGMPLFQLTAHTGVRITAQYTLDAWVDPWRNPPREFRRQEDSKAGFFFDSKFMEGDPIRHEITAFSDWISPPNYQHETGQISVLLRNDKDHMATIWGKWGAVAGGTLPSIPEPSTYALMLAGLGVLGVAAKRRRS
ncbi:PEP-CTERM sorting domain-containing protein [Azohydromonas lata]|uniref:PEP-CTERM sorting domain-containing protein n=1 Tax=Azohydromonas lata TaxID=45677 RepID=A0ABU5IF00_9BURK|nr:PEP-CTERM sorting domain-containing protein [Azohydromonas lata]MDZ5457404.1 PEP-CTERM sorting domain-containing protein [Azohydromonas lata]